MSATALDPATIASLGAAAGQQAGKAVVGAAGAASTAAGQLTPAVGTPGFAPPSAQGNGTLYSGALQEATAEAANEITSQVGPLQTEAKTIATQGSQAQQAIGDEFKSLMPAAQQSAVYTGQFNEQAAAAQAQIAQQASSQLNVLSQNQAAQAQQLAQKVGGPVSTGQFTGAVDPYADEQANSGAINQLTGLQLGVSGTDEAQQFAGQVLPAMQTEQQAAARASTQDQITAIHDKIAQIEGTRSKLIDAKLPDLIKAQQTYQLDQANLKLKQQQDAETWAINNAKLQQEDAKLASAQSAQQFKQKYSEQQLTEREQALTAQEREAAARIGVSEQEYALRAAQYSVSDRLASQRLQIQTMSNARSLIDAVVGGSSSNKPITETVKQTLSPDDPLVKAAATYTPGLGGKPPSNIYFDAKTNSWYTYQKLTMTPQQWASKYGTHGQPVTDPNALYRVLTKAKIPSGMAISLIQAKLGLADWKPGQPIAKPTTDLTKMSIGDLTSLAVSRGFKPSPLAVSRQRLIDFIQSAGK